MTTEGVELDNKSSPPKAITPTRLNTLPEENPASKKDHPPAATKGNFSADTLVTQGHPMLPGLYATAGSAAGTSIDQEIRCPVGPSFSGGINDNAQDCKAPPKTPVKDCGLLTNTLSGRKVLFAPSSFVHHRRESSRLSSLPRIPSPLGPGHFVDHLGTDYSGLVSPLPSPEVTRRPEKKATPSPQKLDLHALKVSANPVGSPYRRKSSENDRKSFGHDRKITDPFVEKSEKLEKAGLPSPFVAQAKHNGGFQSPAQVQVLGSPATFQFSSSPSMQHGVNGPYTHTYGGFAHSPALPDFHVPDTPVFAQFPPDTPITPTFPTFTPTIPTYNGFAPRADLPIPPPPLSSVQGQLQHSPEARARLDARASIRAEWIKTEGAKIAALARETHAATMKFQQSGAQEDLDEWRRLSALYTDVTTLSKRQEERRKMFMPQGMSAMKTGVVGDQSAAFSHDQSGEQGEKQEQLLGFKMAYIERIIAEMKIAKEEKERKEEEEDEITPELLGTLSAEEKKMLRKHLVDRLSEGAERRED
jgi:hypothetical protein